MLASGALLGAGNFFYPYLTLPNHLLAWNILFGCAAAFLATLGKTSPPKNITWVLALGAIAVFVVQLAATAWWPNAGDEYGYLFLADTLLHGRLWNPPPPVPHIFDVAWIFARDGKWFSQYASGWPGVLVPFRAVHAAWAANPLLTLLLGLLAWRCLRERAVPRETAAALTALLLFSPFTLFNGASYFPHTLTADLVLGIMLLQFRDEIRPDSGLKIATGLLFGLLSLTRYEAFALTGFCYGADLLWRRRSGAAADFIRLAAGAAAPLTLGLLYNAAITGNPFETPYAWASPGAALGLPIEKYGFFKTLAHAGLQSAHWAGELIAFGGLIPMAAIAAALIAKMRARTLRWFDLLLPVTLCFFFFYPFDGGHEFGPRYWFFAWPAAFITIGTALPSLAEKVRMGRWVLSAPRLSGACLKMFFGTACALAAFNSAYVAKRREVFFPVPQRLPAIVLIPSRNITVSPLHSAPIWARSDDFARNGISFDEPVFYGRADVHFTHQTEFRDLACSVGKRHVYIWVAPGELRAVDC